MSDASRVDLDALAARAGFALRPDERDALASDLDRLLAWASALEGAAFEGAPADADGAPARLRRRPDHPRLAPRAATAGQAVLAPPILDGA